MKSVLLLILIVLSISVLLLSCREKPEKITPERQLQIYELMAKKNKIEAARARETISYDMMIKRIEEELFYGEVSSERMDQIRDSLILQVEFYVELAELTERKVDSLKKLIRDSL